MDRNGTTLEEVRLEILRRHFRGKVILHCDDGVIEDVEVVTRRAPPWKRNGNGLDGKAGSK